MSCRQPGRRVGQTAGVSSGLSALSGPVSDTTGRLLTAATQFTDRLGSAAGSGGSPGER